MKGFILSLGILFFSAQGSAARWIVENPSQLPSQQADFKVIKEFSIGAKNFIVVETQDSLTARGAFHVQSSLTMLFSAKKTMQDIPIELVSNDMPTFEDRAPSGWHVQRMQYDNLDPSYQGQGVVVAVLDTGVDITHSQLKNNIWTNINEVPNNGIDDDGNGYIDDVNGWNFDDDNGKMTDDQGHGTHCAGIIAAAQHPTRADRGAAPKSIIMPIRVLGSTQTFLSDAAEAVVYATNNGAHILSNSWRVYQSWSQYYNAEGAQLLAQAIAYAGEKGVLFVAAAGNESKNLDTYNATNPILPLGFANLPNMIGIASGDYGVDTDTRSYFTNYGKDFTHLAAPGSNIYSTIPGGGWMDMSGTSMATPLVAGALARVMSKGYTPFQAYQILAYTVDPVAKNTWDSYVAYGYINIAEALKY